MSKSIKSRRKSRSKKPRRPRKPRSKRYSKKSRRYRKPRYKIYKTYKKSRVLRSKRNDGITSKESWDSFKKQISAFISKVSEKWKKFKKSLSRSPSLNVIRGINLFSKGSSIDVINDLLKLIESDEYLLYGEQAIRNKIRSIRGIRATLKYNLIKYFEIINKAKRYITENRSDPSKENDIKRCYNSLYSLKIELENLIYSERNKK
jgi:hypothetical protein